MAEKQIIISIGREYGSGGHEIASRLAEKFNLNLYDSNLLQEVANEHGMNAENLTPYDELQKSPVISRTVRGFSNSNEKNVAEMQFNFLKKKAKDGESFVVVGRCSEEVLKGFDCLIAIFIIADADKKAERIQKIHGVDKAKAQDMIKKQDKKRKAYHDAHCEGKWGDSKNYDLSINSSRLGIDGTLEMLVNYVNARKELL